MNKKIQLCAAAVFACIVMMLNAAVPVTAADHGRDGGGGYSATGQVRNVGYTSKLYDATDGLPTSDSNYVLASSDGYIWLAGYSGIVRYDGNNFTRLDTSEGLTNGRALFEDSSGRMWIGTNDNGVVVISGNSRTHFSYKDGLPASSIRSFAEDREGNIYIGTTAGVCYVDRNYEIHSLRNERLNEERVLRLDSDAEGRIYGQTKNGIIFRIEGQEITEIYSSEELGLERVSTIKTDPFIPGKLYLGTDSDFMYHGYFGDPLSKMDIISLAPLSGAHWISYDCNRLWVSSISAIGYLDGNENFRVIDNLSMNSGIEMMTSDYQGNMWFASSTQGVMKIVTSDFVDVSQRAGIPAEVANAVCIYKDSLYAGTDSGLKIIEPGDHEKADILTRYIGNARVRCIETDGNDLWVGTYTDEIGLVHYSRDGSIISFSTQNGMPDNEIRCIKIVGDRKVIAGTNSGIAIIENDKVTRTIGADEGLKNTIVMTVETDEEGTIYAGTDGGGIYVIKGSQIKCINRDNGLTSDVVLRIKKDEEHSLYWIVTSNSIEYMKYGVIDHVSTFPYNNNYDLFPDNNGYMWVTSSQGIYRTNINEMLKNDVKDQRLYTVDNGLTSYPTAQGYCAAGVNGFLYIPCRNGICRVNIDHYEEDTVPLKAAISSIYCGDEQIFPGADGKYTIPATAARIRITAAVMDYSLLNPIVQVYLEGKEDEGISVPRSSLQPLEYTGLEYGSYTLHIRVLDKAGKKIFLDEKYSITKKPRLGENPIVRMLSAILVALAAGIAVWQVMKKTVIRNQYTEIKLAKEEAERANSAKSRFLANISHEIRTPINTIMGMNEMAMREDATGVPKPYFMSMMNYAFDIRNASESLLSLINDLLDISKIESGKMHLVEQEYDTQDMLRSIVSMIRVRSIEKELTFDVVVDEILPSRMFGDQGKIKQIVLNLLTNAVKYTDMGGFSLCVSMDEREDDECKLRFAVKDTGIGVKEEDKDKLFTAYERLDEQKNSGIQGTGLGLDISRRFAELMGGTLTCESEYGVGSEFTLTLKQKIIDRTPVGIFMEHDEGNAKGPYVPQFIAPDADILVVDDNPMNLNVIKGLLKGTKVFVSTAASGEECLEKIKDTKFNVVLLDHMMPGMDGVETMAEILKIDPDLPVYALTANSAAGEEYYRSKGFTGYLSKPIDSLTLEKSIMKHLPEEMMEKPAEDVVVEELQEIPEELLWIYDTEGISVPEGIKNSGGVANYIFGLNLFLDTIDTNAKVLRDSYESDNIRLYTIKVHSLKSSAKIIGAMELAGLAASLEEAGNNNDKDFIDENAGKLLAEYEAFKDKLERLQLGSGNEDKEPIPEKELKNAYRALADVIPQMDYDSVEMILDKVNEYALEPEDEKLIKELTRMLRNFEWEKMEETIKCQQNG